MRRIKALNSVYRSLFNLVDDRLIMILLFNLVSTPKKMEDEVIFSDFMTKVKAGEVEDVVIKENLITGRLKDGKKFRTYSAGYPELVNELMTKGVKIAAKPPEQNPWYVNFFFFLGRSSFSHLYGYSLCGRCRQGETKHSRSERAGRDSYRISR